MALPSSVSLLPHIFSASADKTTLHHRPNTPYLDATHIFDGLDDFPTHVAHMRFGVLVTEPTPWPFSVLSTSKPTGLSFSSLYQIALRWLTEDKEYRKQLEKQGRKLRGPRHDEVCSSLSSCLQLLISNNWQLVPSDSETFYKK